MWLLHHGLLVVLTTVPSCFGTFALDASTQMSSLEKVHCKTVIMRNKRVRIMEVLELGCLQPQDACITQAFGIYCMSRFSSYM